MKIRPPGLTEKVCTLCDHWDNGVGGNQCIKCLDHCNWEPVVNTRACPFCGHISTQIKWLSEWEDDLIWCPSQLTRRFEHDGEERELYCRWRWCDPWRVSIYGGPGLGCGLTQDTPISEVHEMAETMLRSWLCV